LRLFFDRDREGTLAGGGGGSWFTSAEGPAGAIAVESITCFTPLVCEAIRSAANRAASSGTWPVSVTTPFLLSTVTEAALSNGSENILALISVVIASSFGAACLLHDTTINAASMAATKTDLLPDMFFLPNPKTILREAKRESNSAQL
jgi:hypothetical protein